MHMSQLFIPSLQIVLTSHIHHSCVDMFILCLSADLTKNCILSTKFCFIADIKKKKTTLEYINWTIFPQQFALKRLFLAQEKQKLKYLSTIKWPVFGKTWREQSGVSIQKY